MNRKFFITGASGFIGTNLVEHLLREGCEVFNADIAEPLNPEHRSQWRPCDILDSAAIQAAVQQFRPDVLIHLAARTDCDETVPAEEGYRVNTAGTAHVLEAIAQTSSIRRVIITSSQYVCGPDHDVQDMDDYRPHTQYGQSKVITEQLTKRARLPCPWTIIRPTNIWGPWHLRYRREAWRVIRRGLYLHPGGPPVIRCYGYVGNVIAQIEKILELPKDQADRLVLYVGDAPVDIYEWANAFSLCMKGRPARKVPRSVIRGLGLLGNAFKMVGLKFPITTSRYRSMTQNYPTPMERTFELLGRPPASLMDGVKLTVEWLESYGWNT